MSSLAAGPALTLPERERAIAELEASRRELLAALAGLTSAQWAFKPAPDRWSIVECLEHIALAEDAYFRTITERMTKAPPPPEKAAEVRDKDDYVLKTMPDRTAKRVTAPTLEPKGASPLEALHHFGRSRDRFVAYVRETQDDLRSRFQPHRATGLIDGYQWILLAVGHSRRHLEQIQEVKADPQYPGRQGQK
jgi:DinB superfamily